jgi:hypothetical protein
MSVDCRPTLSLSRAVVPQEAMELAGASKHKKKRRKALFQKMGGTESAGFPKPSQLAAVAAELGQSPAPQVLFSQQKGRRVTDVNPDVSKSVVDAPGRSLPRSREVSCAQSLQSLLVQACGLCPRGSPPFVDMRTCLSGIVLLLVSGIGQGGLLAARKEGLLTRLSDLPSAKLFCCKSRRLTDVSENLLFVPPMLVSKLAVPLGSSLSQGLGLRTEDLQRSRGKAESALAREQFGGALEASESDAKRVKRSDEAAAAEASTSAASEWTSQRRMLSRLPPGPFRPMAARAMGISQGVLDDSPPSEQILPIHFGHAVRSMVTSWTDLDMLGTNIPTEVRDLLILRDLAFRREGEPPAPVPEGVVLTRDAEEAVAVLRAGKGPFDLPTQPPSPIEPTSEEAPPALVEGEGGAIGVSGEYLSWMAQAAASCPILNLVGIDCEMVKSERGLELARVTLVDACGNVLLDRFVRPRVPVLDFVTEFSGITPEMLREDGPALSFDVAQREVVGVLNALPWPVLVGHSLENDMRALGILHTRLMDTSLLFPHRGGWPKRNKLSFLTTRHLGRSIQADSAGHSSVEDAHAALELVLLRMWRGPGAALSQGARSSRTDCLSLVGCLSHEDVVSRTVMVGSAAFLRGMMDGDANGVSCDAENPRAVCGEIAKHMTRLHQERLRHDTSGIPMAIGRVEATGLMRIPDPHTVSFHEPSCAQLDLAISTMLHQLPLHTLVVVVCQGSLRVVDFSSFHAPPSNDMAVGATLERLRTESPAVQEVVEGRASLFVTTAESRPFESLETAGASSRPPKRMREDDAIEW